MNRAVVRIPVIRRCYIIDAVQNQQAARRRGRHDPEEPRTSVGRLVSRSDEQHLLTIASWSTSRVFVSAIQRVNRHFLFHPLQHPGQFIQSRNSIASIRHGQNAPPISIEQIGECLMNRRFICPARGNGNQPAMFGRMIDPRWPSSCNPRALRGSDRTRGNPRLRRCG